MVPLRMAVQEYLITLSVDEVQSEMNHVNMVLRI
jgi:hypothetical protein